MKSISGLGLGLCVVFGCLLLALIAELYYLLWWKKKRIINKIDEENGIQIPQKRSNFSHILSFCRGHSSSLRSTAQELCNSPTLVHEPQSSNSNNKDLWLKKPFAEENMGNFPRFLFTITEETREDLESEDGIFKNRKHSTSRSNLSDLLQILETPFLTPLASPPYFTPPLTPSFCDQNCSPFLEWERDAEFNRLRASPPPMFKFLRDAEEKQRRRMVVGEDDFKDEEENGQFITLVIDEKQEENDGICIKNYCSSDLEENDEDCFSSRSSSHR
ncbi:hypothetical protein C2S52_019421 [Perilla frutescens var. hirtella]|uniref:Uncharacterized protein n=1 Tax=Perilla frutescens var. hirtella TaxID=608512 RepID=A0AAD4P8D5_PERFH|nr:hypothetical protein C2S52_019421 [Perilla frutescens var. hirtella]KAH6806304.1 hypothetical protein C2S51_031135 [Perilla frutescens var. frutescens]KAH6829557.1 hypothetical protein C2S53_012470 [Perilla frutescens var. hirtella]